MGYTFTVYLNGEDLYANEDVDGSGEPGVEYLMASRFIKNLNLLSAIDPFEPILVHMNTIGGWWEHGLVIYQAIQAYSELIR